MAEEGGGECHQPMETHECGVGGGGGGVSWGFPAAPTCVGLTPRGFHSQAGLSSHSWLWGALGTTGCVCWEVNELLLIKLESFSNVQNIPVWHAKFWLKYLQTALMRNSQEADTLIIISNYPCMVSLRLACNWHLDNGFIVLFLATTYAEIHCSALTFSSHFKNGNRNQVFPLAQRSSYFSISSL